MLREHLYAMAGRLYPRLHRLPESERYAAAGYVWRALLFIPPTLIGIAWLASVTDTVILQAHGLFLLVLFIFLLIFSTLWFETYFVTASGSYRSERRSFWGEAMWSGVLVFGPTVAWLGVIMPWAGFIIQRREARHTGLQAVRLFSQ